jgi:FHS family glucose/mannose:H+ symporter-like MFS transporter
MNDPAAPASRGLPATPHLALLHGCMLLSGFGTVFLGALLPTLAASAHASDSGSGLFFTAQFIGAFFGGVTTSSRLWFSLIRGSIAATLGFLLLALCARSHAPLPLDVAALLPLGFGVGQMLTSVNLLASRRYQEGRGAALSLVNLTWSLGAVSAPFALGRLLPHVALTILLFSAAFAFACACGATILNARRGGPEPRSVSVFTAGTRRLPTSVFVYFGALLLLYGGVETSLGGWVTTFGMRYGSGTLSTSALGETALWIGITTGRAVAPILLRFLRESVLLTGTLAAAAIMAILLSQSSGATMIIAAAFVLGMTLASWFPLVLSAMLGEGASAGEVGTIIAVSGIGAAMLPLVTGVVSRHTGSLRTALLVPLCGLLVLLAMSLRKGPANGLASAPSTSPESV